MLKINKNKPGENMCAKNMPSDARNPDLDWSQVRETVLMLNLAVSHIERTVIDGDDSATNLAQSFTFIMNHVQRMVDAAEDLPDPHVKEGIRNDFREVSEKGHDMVVAFQFFDKLAQRLSHISHSLGLLGDLLADGRRLYNPTEWCKLQDIIKSNYRILSDRIMFEAILNGATVEEALQISTSNLEQTDNEDNVEFF